MARRLAAYSTDLEAGVLVVEVRIPDQRGTGSGRHALWAIRATVLNAVDFQRVVFALFVPIPGIFICTSRLNQAQIDEIDPSDGPFGSGGQYQPTGHMPGAYKPSGGR